MSFKAVLFDLDGTLVDTAPDFVKALNAMREHHNLSALDPDRIRQTISNGARGLVELGFRLTPTDSDYGSRHAELLAYYHDVLLNDLNSSVFNGLQEGLDDLKSREITWGIVTNKPRRFTEILLEGLNLDQHTSVTVCPDDVERTKPDPEPILKACQHIEVDPAHTLYIGDHIRDIEAGRAAGCTTISSHYGYIDEDDDPYDWRADHNAATPIELTKLIKDLTQHV